MADVICLSCHTPNAPTEALCIVCGYELTHESTSSPEVAEEPTRTCPACGAPIPDPANRVCVDCLEPLSPIEVKLRLHFGANPVDVPATGLLLGRDPTSPAAPLLAAHDNISRKHATVGVTDGQAWVRDENSTNGTYVDDHRVSTTDKTPLQNGSTLRMGSNVTAKVELQCPA